MALWERWPRREVFAHPAFGSLFARQPSERALAAVYEGAHGAVIYPFLLRALHAEPWWPENLPPAFDIATAYGHGGPFVFGEVDPGEFWPRFDDWAARQRVVSELVRFSLFTDEMLPGYPGVREERLLSVVRALDTELSGLWAEFDPKVRKNVRAAERNGLCVEADTTGARLDDFLRIYTHTLDRRRASPRAYLPRELFQAIHRTLQGQFAYFHVLRGADVVATELILVSTDTVYSFLGGTEESAKALRPNDFLKYEVMKWARAQGKRRFVLGSGFAGEDGVFRFKRSFARNGVVPFSIGQRVLEPELYDALIATRAARGERPRGPVGFPPYRF